MAARRERTQSDRLAQPVRGRTTGGLGLPGGAAGEGGAAGTGRSVAPPAVEARDLHKSFPTLGGEPIEILHGISCAMMPGRMTALVGPSGSGKSTALLCLAGLEPMAPGRAECPPPCCLWGWLSSSVDSSQSAGPGAEAAA